MSDDLETAEAALAAGEYDKATAAALVSLVASAGRRRPRTWWRPSPASPRRSRSAAASAKYGPAGSIRVHPRSPDREVAQPIGAPEHVDVDDLPVGDTLSRPSVRPS